MTPVTITIRKNGPYRVEGDFTLLDHEGKAVEVTPGKPVSLCRCGASTKKPFCDGTHSKIGFIGAEEAARALDAAQVTRE
jgi:CDGSH-type Zn-finger protein